MVAAGANLVAGLFESRTRADAALDGLHRLGLTDRDVEVGAPAPGQYRVEYDEAAELGRGAVLGVAIGIPVGCLVSIVLLTLAVPEMSMDGVLVLGITLGAFWGIFFGGLGGVVPKVLAQEHGGPRCAIADGSADVVVIAQAGDQTDAVHAEMQRSGALRFLADVPLVQPR